MPANGEEALTSFAENPTKSVERDALVEAQFTRPDEVEKTKVYSSWFPCNKGGKWKFPPRLVLGLILCIILSFVIVGIILAINSLIESSHQAAPQEVIVYTLPTEDPRTAHGKVIMPAAMVKKPSPVHMFVDDRDSDDDTQEPIVDETFDIVGTTTELPESETEPLTWPMEKTTTTTTTTTTSTVAPTTSTLPDNLQFYQTMGGEKRESCMERFAMGSPSGVYPVTASNSFDVYCDMETTTGGWTVVQRRTDRDGSFHKRTMKEYTSGFGELRGNHWLGLEKLSELAPSKFAPATLRIEIEGDTCDSTCSRRFPDKWVGEWNIHVGTAKEGFKLTVHESHAGNLTFNGVDALMNSNGARFSTPDQDQDESDYINCAQFRMLGPWWHGQKCSDVALNGYYQTTAERYDTSDKNQNAKRYFAWAFDKQTLNDSPYIIHIRKSVMLLKPSF